MQSVDPPERLKGVKPLLERLGQDGTNLAPAAAQSAAPVKPVNQAPPKPEVQLSEEELACIATEKAAEEERQAQAKLQRDKERQEYLEQIKAQAEAAKLKEQTYVPWRLIACPNKPDMHANHPDLHRIQSSAKSRNLAIQREHEK